MEQSELLRYVVDTLEGLPLRYFITGSHAAMQYGEPRFTNDIDVVVDLPPSKVRELCARFPIDDFYVSEDAARGAATRGGQFNVIHPESGLKVDLIVAKEDQLDQERLRRATRLPTPGGGDAMFSTPEDLILKKMDFYREGGSDKHLRDIASVLKISGDRVDVGYVGDWAARLGLSQIWEAILQRIGQR